MPDEYLKDSLNKSHGIRSGEPKRPESLIEIPSMVPEVPEVSLCFTQERNQPHHQNRGSNVELTGVTSEYRHQRHHQTEMLHRHKNESYNTWKAKNAQTLHNITGGQERAEFGSKPPSSTKKSAGLVRKQNSGNGIYSPPMIATKHSTNEVVELDNPSHHNVSSFEYRSRVNGQQQIPASNQTADIHSVEHTHANYKLQTLPYPQHQVHPFPQHQVQQPREIYNNPRSPTSILRNQYSCKNGAVSNMPLFHQTRDNSNASPGFCVPSYCNKLQCLCVKCKEAQNNSANGNQFISENPSLTKEARGNMQFVDPTKLYPSLDAGLINNHLSSLFHLINIQNEQISMLCQEMSTQKMITSALHEDIKKIYAIVSTNEQINNEISPTKDKSCRCCSCENNGDQAVKKNTSEDKNNFQVGLKCIQSKNVKSPTISNDVEKKSVGVMTSSLDNNVTKEYSSEKNKHRHFKEKTPRAKENGQKALKLDKPKVYNSSPNKRMHVKENHKEEERKLLDSAKIRDERGEPDESILSDDSFSLDEAAVVVRAETEPGNVSPEASIHVNMPDYSASSAESDTSESSVCEDGGHASGSDGESSDPQIGWTFYDRVVGQVNNMLKKTSTDPRQEYAHTQRNNTGNVLYQCNGDYETENWSKRVTFDGPPLEDSDNNGVHMPRYHHFRTNQDYRTPVAGGQERVQDFLVCDYANGGNNLSLVNGSTNVSFATYRYYQRHQLLPPPPQPSSDQVFPDQPRMKKKSKSKKNEKTPPTSQKRHKRRTGGPPSKILDVSALKHQPKLF